MTELDIINACIATQGQAPLNSLAAAHPLKSAIQNELENIRRRVLSRGWWFNREPLTYEPDIAGRIIVAGDALTVRAQDRSRKVARRGSNLYDVTNGTDLFTTSIKVIVVRDIPLEQLEEVAAQYIRALTLEWFVAAYDGTTKVSSERERIDLNAEETRNSPDNWLMSSPRVQRTRAIRAGVRGFIG